MPPTRHDYEAALAEIEEDTAMPPGMTQQQYAEAREMMERVEDVEFYEAMTEREYERLKRAYLVIRGPMIREEYDDKPVSAWKAIGESHEAYFFAFAVKWMREKYLASGDLLECVREAVMGVEA